MDSATSKRRPLFDTLPAEVRVEIYPYLVILPDPVELVPEGRSTVRLCLSKPQRRRLHLSILLVCKKAYLEATPLLYGENQFLFRDVCVPDFRANSRIFGQQVRRIPFLAPFLDQIGRTNAGLLRNIRIELDELGDTTLVAAPIRMLPQDYVDTLVLIRARCTGLKTLEIGNTLPPSLFNPFLPREGGVFMHMLHHQGGLKYLVASATFEKIVLVVGVREEDLGLAKAAGELLLRAIACTVPTGEGSGTVAGMRKTSGCSTGKWAFEFKFEELKWNPWTFCDKIVFGFM